MPSEARLPNAPARRRWNALSNSSRQRGVALVAVLWVLVLLPVIAASLTTSTRTGSQVARNLVDNAKARALADAGVHRAILALFEPDPGRQLALDGTQYRFVFAGGEVLISLQDEAGKVDLNRAPEALIEGLFVAAGLEAAEAEALTSAVLDYRDADDAHRLNGAEDAD